jgi:hypothetical protein
MIAGFKTSNTLASLHSGKETTMGFRSFSTLLSFLLLTAFAIDLQAQPLTGDALMVVRSTTISEGDHDDLLRDRLEGLGLTVAFVADDAPVPALSSYELILVSETCISSNVNPGYNTTIPLIQMEVGANDDLNLGGGVDGTDYTGYTLGTDINILTVAHYITEFLPSAGAITITDTSSFSFGTTATYGAGAEVLADWPSDPTWKALLVWEVGAALFDSSPAPERRVIFGLRNDPSPGMSHVLPDGLTLFDRSVTWVMGQDAPEPPPTPSTDIGDGVWTRYQ